MRNIKPLFILLALFFILIPSHLFAQDENTAQVENPVIGKLSFYIGDVRVRPLGETMWQKPELNQDLRKGDALRSGAESRAEVQLTDKNVIRIGEQTIFEFDNIEIADGKVSGSGKLAFGKFWSKLKSLGNDGLEVKSPNAVMAVRGTTWRADAGTDSSLNVFVYDGQVDVNSQEAAGQEIQQPQSHQQNTYQPPVPVPGPYQVTLEEWVQITKGMQLTVRSDGYYSKQQFNVSQDAQDDWVQWNTERDGQMFR